MIAIWKEFQVQFEWKLYQIRIPTQLVPLVMKSLDQSSTMIYLSFNIDIFKYCKYSDLWAIMDINGFAFYNMQMDFYWVSI